MSPYISGKLITFARDFGLQTKELKTYRHIASDTYLFELKLEKWVDFWSKVKTHLLA